MGQWLFSLFLETLWHQFAGLYGAPDLMVFLVLVMRLLKFVEERKMARQFKEGWGLEASVFSPLSHTILWSSVSGGPQTSQMVSSEYIRCLWPSGALEEGVCLGWWCWVESEVCGC